MKKATLLLCGLLFLLGIVALGTRIGTQQSAVAQSSDLSSNQFVVRLYYDDPAAIQPIAATFDVLEHRDLEEQYVLILVNPDEYALLQSLNYDVAIDVARSAEFQRPHVNLPNQLDGIPGYPCYRTVEETFTSAANMTINYPDLATWIDIGDSWERTEFGSRNGYDIQVLKLTNVNTPGPKPVFFAMSDTHAREYAPPELSTRFAENLLANYGVDADVTWLLDYHEIHLLLMTNPDGRKQAETGLSWRKNTNQNYCSPTSNSRGADLNRNFEFQWNCCGGSSGSECAFNYRGPTAASEPETQAVQTYVRSIFPDQRDDDLNAAAPDDAMGVFFDIHSYGEDIFWPWGWGNPVAPNGVDLQTLGRKFAWFNDYYPVQAIAYGVTDGATDDFAYGDLGVAAYTFEIGTAFFQSCTVFENTILPDNLPALIYAAKASRAPYQLPSGPDAVNVTLWAESVLPGTPVTVSAEITDLRYSTNNGVEPTQNIAAAEYYVDTPYWITDTLPVALPMVAADGTFDEKSEDVTAVIDTTGLAAGRHTVFVRGQDADGNWGVISAEFLDITPAPTPTPTNTPVPPTPTPTPIPPTSTFTPTPTNTAVPPTPTFTPTPTSTAVPPTATATSVPPTATFTPTPTTAPTMTSTPTMTPTATSEPDNGYRLYLPYVVVSGD
ncbi:MAG: M14 family metallopeptidase [Anaerolineae bacterium]|nr:M14 family metallopeptidase [Anaerolineae bacterium]MCO5190886.1 M14 family metallopeptidase [Anaerolineae bacterium]